MDEMLGVSEDRFIELVTEITGTIKRVPGEVITSEDVYKFILGNPMWTVAEKIVMTISVPDDRRC